MQHACFQWEVGGVAQTGGGRDSASVRLSVVGMTEWSLQCFALLERSMKSHSAIYNSVNFVTEAPGWSTWFAVQHLSGISYAAGSGLAAPTCSILRYNLYCIGLWMVSLNESKNLGSCLV